AEDVIAENNPEFAGALGDQIRPIHVVRIADRAPTIAADEALRRMAQDFLVSGNPTYAVLSQQRQHRLADGALGRPHAAWRPAEGARVHLDGPADVSFGVLG